VTLARTRGGSGENFVALTRFLQPLIPFLERDDVFEISVNEPGLAFVETTTGSVPCPIPELTYDHLLTLAELIAHSTQQQISARQPLLSASLRNGDRVQVVRPPACEPGKVVLSIRRHGVRDLGLEDYEAQGALRHVTVQTQVAPGHTLRRLLSAGRSGEFLREAVRSRRNIIVSGGTGSGKTTFINALLRLLPEHERLVVIEDSREVHVRQRNCAHLLISRGGQGEAQITVQDLLEATLRLRPDRIMLGELRGAEAYSFLRAVNSGHPGSITSLHADSAERAFEQLVLMATPVARGLTGALIADYARSVVDVVVQLQRCPSTGERRISEIRLREEARREAKPRRSPPVAARGIPRP
jgi:type IV secretion system protein VirB11